MFAQPAKKLLFMGGEFGQWGEWSHDGSLEWHLLQYDSHRGLQQCVADLNRSYRAEKALHEMDCDPSGFEWIDGSDSEQSTISFMRKSRSADQIVVVVCNFTPVPRQGYRLGVPREGYWHELLNTDSRHYGGTGMGNLGGVSAENVPVHGRPYSLSLTIPPLAAVFLKNTD
jgi:1,4-alpha-glucan branching enzyme